MNAYTEIVTITAPIELAVIAARIALAIDPDMGGDKSFRPSLDGLTISATTPCTPEYRALLMSFKNAPAMLHSVVVADYSQRWLGFTAPTLAECESFCAAATIF